MSDVEMSCGFAEGADLLGRGILSMGYEYRKGYPVTLDFKCLPETEGFQSLSSITSPNPSITDDSITKNPLDRNKRQKLPCKLISFTMPAKDVGGFLTRIGLSKGQKYDLERLINKEYELASHHL